MRVMLIANPSAGQGKVRWIAGLTQSALERCGAEVTLVLTGGSRDAAEAAHYAVRSHRFDRIVVAGGDGTINQVVGQVAHTSVPMAVLPLGTANSLARELRLPFNLIQAARIAIEGPVIAVDIGRLRDSYFLLEVSAGFDAAVVCSVEKAQKRWLGPGAYVFNALSLLRKHTPFQVTCIADGVEIRASCNVVLGCNTATYAYGVRLASQASLTDGLLDLCIFHAQDHSFVAQVGAALRNHLGPRVGAHTIQARKIRIESDPIVLVQMDGDPAGETPVEIECVPQALNMVVSARYARRMLKRVGDNRLVQG